MCFCFVGNNPILQTSRSCIFVLYLKCMTRLCNGDQSGLITGHCWTDIYSFSFSVLSNIIIIEIIHTLFSASQHWSQFAGLTVVGWEEAELCGVCSIEIKRDTQISSHHLLFPDWREQQQTYQLLLMPRCTSVIGLWFSYWLNKKALEHKWGTLIHSNTQCRCYSNGG